MLAPNGRTPISCIILSLAFAATCFAADTTIENTVAHPAAAKEWENPDVALTALQKSHARGGNTFIVQGELDGLIDEEGGGACASAAAIDVLQVLRAMAAMDKLPNPQRVVIAAFADQRELLKGRVTN